MNEELNIKIKVDTSAITPAVNKLKNEVSNVNKQVKTSLSGASSSSGDKQVKSTEKLSKLLDKTEKVVNNIKSGISGWDIAKTILGIKGIEYAFKNTKKSIKELGNIIGNTFDGHLFNAIGFSLKDETDHAEIELEELRFVVKGRMKQIKESLGGAFSNLKSGNIKKSLTSLKIALTGGASAGKTFGAVMKSIGVILKSVATIAGGLTIALAGLIGVMGVVAAFKISKLGNEVYHTAQQFGFSTKAFQEWSYIMERNGSSIEDLKGFLETLNSEQGAVITGSEEAAQRFRNLGISAEEAANMDSQTLFETTIAKLQGIEDATLRSSYAYEMFGDEASRLMNVINMSNADMGAAINQYHLLGGVMSGELVENSNRLQGSIANMKQAWQGISNTLAEVFIPVVRAVVNWLTKAFVVINLFLRTIFGLDLKTKSASGSVDKATASNNRYTGSLGAAKKAAEELKRVVLGFDELNIVNNPKSSGADSGGGVGSLDMSDIPTIDDSLLNTDDLNLDGIYEWFEEYKKVIAQIVTWSLIGIGALLALIGALTLNIPLFMIGAGMIGLGITIGIKSGAFEELAEGIKKVGGNLKLWFEREILPMFTKEYWENLWSNIKWATGMALSNLGQDITKGFGNIKDWLKRDVMPMFTAPYWISKWEEIINTSKLELGRLGRDLSYGLGLIKNWFNKDVMPMFKSSYWRGNFKSIPEGMKIAMNDLLTIVEKGVNYIVREMNKLSWKVPNWVPGIGGSKWGFLFNKVNMPRLATGGIATKSTLANIGENGREAVLPLENNTEWMDTLADKIAARNSGPTKVVLKVGEKELGWATIDSINSITKQTGAIQLTL